MSSAGRLLTSYKLYYQSCHKFVIHVELKDVIAMGKWKILMLKAVNASIVFDLVQLTHGVCFLDSQSPLGNVL